MAIGASSSLGGCHVRIDCARELLTCLTGFPDVDPRLHSTLFALHGSSTISSLALLSESLPSTLRLGWSRLAEMPLLIFRLVVLALFGSAVVAGISLNVTIDDTLGDSVTGNQIVYSPADNWQSSSNCSECASTFAMAMVYDRTWTLSTHPGNATISFYGSAVYVYCIIADYAEMAFLIDDLFVGTFTFSPSTELYNYPVYTNGELPMGYHTLIIMNGVNETSSGAVLDYIVYTTQPEHLLEIPSTVAQATVTATVYSSSPDAQTRVIVGTVSGIGVFLLLAIGAFVVVLVRTRAERHKMPEGDARKAPSKRSQPSSSQAWEEGAWVNSSRTHRQPSHRSAGSITRALLRPGDGEPERGQSQNASAETLASAVSSDQEKPALAEEHNLVELKSFPAATPASPQLDASMPTRAIPGSNAREYQRRRRPAAAHPRLFVQIPGKHVPTKPPKASSRSLPPLPPPPKQPETSSTQAMEPMRPKSDGAARAKPPPSVAARLLRSSMDLPSIIPSMTPSTGTPQSGDPASERTATTHSTMTTPTRFSIPSMFFIADTSAPLLPARADSVKTLSTKLVPNRHPDMEVPGPLPVLSVPLEGGSTSGTTTLSATPVPRDGSEQSDRRWFTRKSDGSASGGSRSDSASESSSRR